MGFRGRSSKDGDPSRRVGSGREDEVGRRSGRERESGTFGLKSGGARGAQAAADALRRRRKANKASLTKRHAVYKSKSRLLQDLEDKQAASVEVYVAPELPNVVSVDMAPAVARTAKNHTGSDFDNVDAAVRMEGGLASRAPLGSDESDDDDDPSSEDEGVVSSGGRVDAETARRTGSLRGKSDALPVSADGKVVKSRSYQPYQKELAIAAARQREIVRFFFAYFYAYESCIVPIQSQADSCLLLCRALCGRPNDFALIVASRTRGKLSLLKKISNMRSGARRRLPLER